MPDPDAGTTMMVCGRCGKRNYLLFPNLCFICGRNGGDCCFAAHHFSGVNDGPINLFDRICKECDESGRSVCGQSYQESIQEFLGKANAELTRLRAQWCKRSEELRLTEQSPATKPPRHPEAHYQSTWRDAHRGARTDWPLIGEEARRAWREKLDGEGNADAK